MTLPSKKKTSNNLFSPWMRDVRNDYMASLAGKGKNGVYQVLGGGRK